MNLKALQKPLKLVMPQEEMEASLEQFKARYQGHYQARMLRKLGFEQLPDGLGEEIVNITIELLKGVEVGYHNFFPGTGASVFAAMAGGPVNHLQHHHAGIRFGGFQSFR